MRILRVHLQFKNTNYLTDSQKFSLVSGYPLPFRQLFAIRPRVAELFLSGVL